MREGIILKLTVNLTQFSSSSYYTAHHYLGSKGFRLAPNGTNLGLWKIIFLNDASLMIQIFIAFDITVIFQSPRFVPFGANLTHFGT